MNSKMFSIVTHTWNPVVGCPHQCSYCWARKLADKRFKHLYPDFTKPMFFPKRLYKIPMKGFVFVVDMGDLFADEVPSEWIKKIFYKILASGSKATFLFLTKNPERYHEYLDYYRPNMLFGATVESNYIPNYSRYSKAPDPLSRLHIMKELSLYSDLRLFLSIEPVFDFDRIHFENWIIMIHPEIIYIGYDNYNNHLPEPPEEKTLKLIQNLRGLGFQVFEKTIRKAWYEV